MAQSSRGSDDSAKPPSALARALVLLLRKALSKGALARQLAQEGYVEGDINEALVAVQGHGYLHDGRLADSIAHAAVRRGKGPRWVAATMQAREVEPAARACAMNEARAGSKEQALATLRRRLGRLPPLTERAAQARAMRFLLARGFAASDAQYAVSTLRSGPTDVDDMVDHAAGE